MLPRIEYGKTGLSVSRLCFGTGQMNPRRANLSPKEGAELIKYALDLGVNFIDIAVAYETHTHVELALRGIDRSDVVINSKTNKSSAADARAAVEQSIRELAVDYLDIMLLHGVRSSEDLQSREPALAELWRAREDGLIRAVGLSTHLYTGSVMRASIDDPRVEVILTLINRDGVGLRGGTYDEHLGPGTGSACCWQGDLRDEAPRRGLPV